MVLPQAKHPPTSGKSYRLVVSLLHSRIAFSRARSLAQSAWERISNGRGLILQVWSGNFEGLSAFVELFKFGFVGFLVGFLFGFNVIK